MFAEPPEPTEPSGPAQPAQPAKPPGSREPAAGDPEDELDALLFAPPRPEGAARPSGSGSVATSGLGATSSGSGSRPAKTSSSGSRAAHKASGSQEAKTATGSRDYSKPSLAASRRFARSKILVRVKNLHKAFGEKKILRGVSFVVHEGETLCIVGGSGTGKSVTLKHVMRLLSPDQGEIWLDGEEITHARGDRLQAARMKLGVNFQFGALLNWLTVYENAALPLRENTNMTEAEIERRVMSKLELLKIPHARDLFPPEISGGMRKRAGLARAVIMEETVKVILYDEPTSGLDPISTALVDEMINEMRERLGLAQIVITHDMASVRRTADSVVVLHEGRIVQYGTPEEIEASSVPYVQQFVSGLTAPPEEAKP
ncbi:MAG: ATP-binding cassette domain-containing protein [Planctomycetes bacterium]|nr:ATP-binding cassette domain-containing protein [Planctomycetota bacterium]